MDLITRQPFPGQRLDFRSWEEWGVVCFPRGSSPGVCFSTELACSLWVLAAVDHEKWDMASFMYLPIYEAWLPGLLAAPAS